MRVTLTEFFISWFMSFSFGCSSKVQCTRFSRSGFLFLFGNHHLPESNPEKYESEITMKARLQPELILQQHQEKIFKRQAENQSNDKEERTQTITHIQKKYVISNAFWTWKGTN